MDADDPYVCIFSRGKRWMPKVYQNNCVYTKPTVQQPDFVKSAGGEDCLRLGMHAWLANILRGDVSWESFMASVPSSCTFKSIGPEGESCPRQRRSAVAAQP